MNVKILVLRSHVSVTPGKEGFMQRVVMVVLTVLMGAFCCLIVVQLRSLARYGIVVLPGVDPLAGFVFGIGLELVAWVVAWVRAPRE